MGARDRCFAAFMTSLYPRFCSSPLVLSCFIRSLSFALVSRWPCVCSRRAAALRLSLPLPSAPPSFLSLLILLCLVLFLPLLPLRRYRAAAFILLERTTRPRWQWTRTACLRGFSPRFQRAAAQTCCSTGATWQDTDEETNGKKNWDAGEKKPTGEQWNISMKTLECTTCGTSCMCRDLQMSASGAGKARERYGS